MVVFFGKSKLLTAKGSVPVVVQFATPSAMVPLGITGLLSGGPVGLLFLPYNIYELRLTRVGSHDVMFLIALVIAGNAVLLAFPPASLAKLWEAPFEDVLACHGARAAECGPAVFRWN